MPTDPISTNPGLLNPQTISHPDRYKIAYEPIYQYLISSNITAPLIVDVGSSHGYATANLGLYLRERGIKPYLIGIEPQYELFRHLPQVLDEVVETTITPNSPLPYEPNSIDVVIAYRVWKVIVSVEDMEKQNMLLLDIAGVIKPEGVFFGDPEVAVTQEEIEEWRKATQMEPTQFDNVVKTINSPYTHYVIRGSNLKRIVQGMKNQLSFTDIFRIAEEKMKDAGA